MLENLKDFVIIKLARELVAQGHRGAGRLIESMRGVITTIPNGMEITIFAADYSKFVDEGVSANRIPFRGRTGRGGVSQYIQALIAFFRLKGSPDPKAAAFATANTHRKEGMPTRASFKFSRTGKRTGFIEETLDKHGQSIDDQLEEAGFSVLNSQIDKALVNLR